MIPDPTTLIKPPMHNLTKCGHERPQVYIRRCIFWLLFRFLVFHKTGTVSVLRGEGPKESTLRNEYLSPGV